MQFEFIVENGDGIPDATSYVELDFAALYLGEDWFGTGSPQEALMKATEYADTRWGPTLMGAPLTAAQTLQWPRRNMWDRYGYAIVGVPTDWKKAVCLYAKEYSNGTLYPAPVPQTKEVKKKSVTVGPITTSTEYTDNSGVTTFLPFPLADSFIKRFRASAGGRVIRN